MSATRPSRFPLHLAVRYCAKGERQWHDGITESVSRSGAMIRTSETNPPTGVVKVVIDLPQEEGGAPAGCLTGFGHVIRTHEGEAGDESASFSIAVKHYRVQRRHHV